MAGRLVMRTGEALVEGDKDYLCAEPEIVIGELDGPVGTALATLVGDQVKGGASVLAYLNAERPLAAGSAGQTQRGAL